MTVVSGVVGLLEKHSKLIARADFRSRLWYKVVSAVCRPLSVSLLAVVCNER